MFLRNNLLFKVPIYRRKYSKTTKTKWQSVVGLEVHAQINTASKLFSRAPTIFSSPVNSNVSLFDCSIPGTLPVLNKKCVELGVLTALALNCKVNPVSTFDRKHYFYSDLPTGYQITQQRAPLAVDGILEFEVYKPGVHKTPYKTKTHIKQIQLEQDSGKSLHDSTRSLVDLNRAGVALMELVFEPDLKNGDEAAAMVKELMMILQKINTCSCKMEEGALRVDANVSINKEGESLGVRTEIKNIGSVRGVAGSVQYEIERQIKVRESGGQIVNETRSWDASNKTTVAMRDKEVQQDYRYMPEPNLPPLHIAMGPISLGCVNADKLRSQIPELPEETRKRLRETLGLTSEQVVVLVNDFSLLKIFEETLEKCKTDGKLLASILINEFYMFLNKNDLDTKDIDCEVEFYGEIVENLQQKKINRNTAKLLIQEIISGNRKHPVKIIEEQNLWQITDDEQLQNLCQEVIRENEKIVKAFKSGKAKVFKALLGSVASKSKNRADMEKCDRILKELLKHK